MCELLGISASQPVHLRYSLHRYAEHGGLLHPNKSGWGMAYRVGKDAILLKEPECPSDFKCQVTSSDYDKPREACGIFGIYER